jgi:adenylate cyclase
VGKKKKKKKKTSGRVKYPIGIKLVIITTLLLLISLGAITTLVSVMVSQDLQITAEDNNFTVNMRSSTEAETILQGIRSNALMLMDTLDAARGGSDSVLSRQASAFYFERNQDIAAIAVGGRTMVNERFFLSNEIDAGPVAEFMARTIRAANGSSAGETDILNASPVFGIPVLAMTFPWQGPGIREIVAVIFSSESLTDTFGNSINTSFMVNHEGDILVHADQALVLSGANMGRDPLVEMLLESREQNFQTLYTDQEGVRYFGAFRKLSITNAAVITRAEYQVVFEGIAATTRRNIYLTGAVLCIAILLIWFFSKSISRPLRRLTSTARKIEAGNFEVTYKGKRRDEIGLLSESFVKMGQALVNFSRFTNLEVAQRVMRGDLALGGVTKRATIFFSDIRSFTAISEKLEPGEVVEFLNDYMTRMVACINETGGVVDKFIGDSVMAHWGTVSTTGSPSADAMNCVRAALAMRAALRDFNRGRDGSDKQPRIRIGCGINTGDVVAGQIGSRERMDYTVIGDAVNLASRTEALNKPLHTDILITENTWRLVGRYLICEEMPPVRVKGKSKPVRLFAVVNLRARRQGEQQRRPVSLREVRSLLGLTAPDLHRVDTGVVEQKYLISSD